MFKSTHILRAATLALCLCCSACLAIQQQIDANSRDLGYIRNQLSRTHNDLEQLRSEVQALSGTLEENNVVHGREIKNIKKRLGSLTATLENPLPGTEGAVPLLSSDIPANNAQSHYGQALKLYNNRDYEKSRSSFQAFLKQYRDNPLTQNAFFWIGLSFFKQKDYRKSIAALEKLIKEFPQGNKVPDAYYWQAVSFMELQEILTAQILLETLMQTYPSSEASQKAKAKHQELKIDSSR